MQGTRNGVRVGFAVNCCQLVQHYRTNMQAVTKITRGRKQSREKVRKIVSPLPRSGRELG
jgi:hypothetical protein